ncbi:oxidoreductase [Longispora fulva]|uniref:CBS domain-containing protein n=1 Tax=Longispora fulva TaxID=619741 RepID=A0A8J7GCN4_9ACTN|nr:CBS domain-containing protein [Longispora fulva]MBG6135191.1 CBS domain-containing protein [Longispora fulva]GIG56574.1 oxidoreductase [Longispora fulva]
MRGLVRNLMTRGPICLPADATLTEAAEHMADHDIGDVLVLDGGTLRGILTDRDLVVRAVAAGLDPDSTTCGELATGHPLVLGPEDPVDFALRLMRQHAVRRLPVCAEGGRPVGILTLGDLAEDGAPASALAAICAADPTPWPPRSVPSGPTNLL